MVVVTRNTFRQDNVQTYLQLDLCHVETLRLQPEALFDTTTLPAKLRASCHTSWLPTLAVVQVPSVKGCSMATSRVRRLPSCIRSLHVALTGGLQINQELHLANLTLPRADKATRRLCNPNRSEHVFKIPGGPL